MMTHFNSLDDVVVLISETKSQNEIGDVISTSVEKPVFAYKKSIRQTEFYQAQTHGLKPELIFVINSFEYDCEEKLIYEDKEYSIIRTYQTGDYLELICERGVINGTS